MRRAVLGSSPSRVAQGVSLAFVAKANLRVCTTSRCHHRLKERVMTGITLMRIASCVCGLLVLTKPVFAQVELSGSYSIRMYEDYIERGPGSYLGDFTGMPMSDEGRAKALSYTSSLPSTIERQCLAQSPWVGQYRPLGLRIWSEIDDGRVIAWVLAGDYLRDTIRIWMDGRPHPSANAWHPPSGFTTGHWEGDPNGSQDANARGTCNTGNEIPSFEDTGKVPHYLPGQNPDEDYMVRTYNIPKEAALGFAHTLYPEYRKTLKDVYKPPPSCG